MANSFIDVLTQANVIGTVFDGDYFGPLRPIYVFDAAAQEKRWAEDRDPVGGDTIVFLTLAALTANTASLDTTAATITASQKPTFTRRTVSMVAYGDHSVIDMLQLPIFNFADTFEAAMGLLRDQGGNSRDVIARAAMDLNRYANETSGTLSSTYHYYGSSGTASSVGPLKSKDVRTIVTDMKGANVSPYADGYYRAIVDPIQAQQLRAETGNAAWRPPHEYKDNRDEIFTGEIGLYEGTRFIVNQQVSGAGTGTISAYFMGREFTGKANGLDLQLGTKSSLDGPQDNLLTMYWRFILGYKIIRREAGRIIETSNTQL